MAKPWEKSFEKWFSSDELRFVELNTNEHIEELKKDIKDFISNLLKETEARVMKKVIEIIKVPEDKVVNVMELAIRNDILEQLLNNLKGIK